MERRSTLSRLVPLAVAALATTGAAGCGDQSGGASSTAATSALAEVVAHGKDVFYLGPSADGHPLWEVPPPDPQSPDLAPVEVHYGKCVRSEETCTSPVVVSTAVVSMAPRGDTGWCGRLEPVLGVPVAVLDGVVSLFTGTLQVSVSDFGDDRDQDSELALLATVRRFGAGAPSALPPPTSDVATWLTQTCGAKPGDVIEHDEKPYTPSTPPDASDPNRLVPDFTMVIGDGSQLPWSTRTAQPLAMVVGSPDVIESQLPRLVQAATVAGRGAQTTEPVGVMGLVWDPKADKFAAPPTTMPAQLTSLGAPVGYTSPVMSPVWFFDAAGNVAEVDTAFDDGGLIALVSTEGVVMRFAPAASSTADLELWLRTLR